MIFATGGRASGATSTRSRPLTCAAASASSTVITPSCAPSGPITRMGLIRICRFTRTRGALLLVLSIARWCSPPQAKEKADPRRPGIRRKAAGVPRRRRLPVGGAKLARPNRVYKTKALPFTSQPPGRDARVVLEHQDPRLGLRPPVELPLGFERRERQEIVAHDPGERQVSARGHEVRKEARALPATFHQYGLVEGHVAGRGKAADPRQHLRFAVDQLERHGLEVVREVARGGPLVGVAREVELPLLHHVAGPGERRD